MPNVPVGVNGVNGYMDDDAISVMSPDDLDEYGHTPEQAARIAQQNAGFVQPFVPNAYVDPVVPQSPADDAGASAPDLTPPDIGPQASGGSGPYLVPGAIERGIDAPPQQAPAPVENKPKNWMQRLSTSMHLDHPAAPSIPVSGAADYQGDIEALKKQYATMPTMQAPNWLERLGAIGIGAGAGWSNAGGRTRQPIDIAAATKSVLYPGYEGKLAQWQSRVAPMQHIAELSGQQVAAQQKAAMDAATIGHLKAQADYMEGLGRTQMLVTEGMEKASNGILKAGTMAPVGVVQDTLKDAAGRYTAREAARRTTPTPEEKYAEAQRIYPASMGGTPAVWRQMAYNPTQVERPEKAERNLNPSDILLHPGDFPPATVKKAQEMFDKEHRPPANNTFNINSALSDDAVDQAAKLYLETGQLGNYSSGPAGAQMRAKIMNRAAELGKDTDLGANRQDYAANSAAIKDTERNRSRVLTSEGTAARNLDLAATVSQKVDRTGSPVLNRYLLYLKGQVAGDDNTQLLNNAVETAANEYANVVSAGSSGGAAATDSARQHARDMLHSGMANGTFQKVVKQMKVEMGNRHASFDDQLASLRSGRQKQPTPATTVPQGGPGRGGAQPVQGGTIIVPTPHGDMKFSNQAQADAYKKAVADAEQRAKVKQ